MLWDSRKTGAAKKEVRTHSESPDVFTPA